MNEEEDKIKKLILVVEDDSVLRPLLVELLSEMQFNVLVAEDGQAALTLLQEINGQQNNIDLLLTDIGLPGINGNDLAKTARKMWPNLSILFITGYAHGVGQLPTDDNIKLITKPFSLGALTSRVEELVTR
ncbi:MULTISPECIES: response regulator [Commensalibacter]|uniref:PAS sensor protein n=2 Tax=Commensalibacter TaxID=1079922 RepID=W7DTK9_9PROT|nr:MULTISPECIES: response regulator [Commensalibacter]EUK18265.1 PAS sensor protein [Commensalibacter papalotli (ex Servin-Garciduenas et al. 2014)]CAI3936651.1 DNA-binding response regulator [Commensalibacter papalotli (ex Botero et al. 2024)]CAI3938995.1 DNA-binding response regulator [Commensalibacter papalotli (ex Botero et al. 2024)]